MLKKYPIFFAPVPAPGSFSLCLVSLLRYKKLPWASDFQFGARGSAEDLVGHEAAQVKASQTSLLKFFGLMRLLAQVRWDGCGSAVGPP